ncbi:MAG: hypothetical protein NVV72_00250 [Asticcacaulis sp.]|nr:hypothetical protein [Asticcacaulis sp.]
MLDTKTYICPPQVKDLPRDTRIGATCRSCGRQWSENVQGLIDRHLGVEFVDLLEWKYRCRDETCGGMVRIAINGEAPVLPPVAPRVSVLARPKRAERPLYPVKAVVKPRLRIAPVIPAAKRQLSLPLVPH